MTMNHLQPSNVPQRLKHK